MLKAHVKSLDMISNINININIIVIIVSLLSSILLSCESFLLNNNRRLINHHYNLVNAVTRYTPEEKDPTFDLPLAVILAGYSFEAYNEPPIGKVAIGSDGTRITFSSSEFIRNIFTGVVMITLDKGEVSKDNQKEIGILEKISSGDLVDPYVIITVQENEKSRVIDTVISSIKKSTAKPIWKESFFLYIIDPAYSKLNFTLMDKDYFKDDDVIGAGSFTVAEFLQFYPKFKSSETKDANPSIDNKPVRIPIPIYLNDNDKSWSLLPRPKRKRTGTIFVEATVTKFDMTQTPSINKSTKLNLPQGATPGAVDWVRLLSSVIEKSQTVKSMKSKGDDKNVLRIVDSITSGLHQVCFIDNPDTDTQASIWADMSKKELILSFRGTEQIKLKDILTDINLIQVSFDDSNPTLQDVKMHSGFLKAYQSVQGALMQILQALLKYKPNININDETPWNIYITGHSLGAALASITAFDIGRINNGQFGSNDAFLSYYGDDKEFISTLSNAKISMYTFGAPRVGNKDFANLFNSLIPNSFRIVNNQDIVARIPRSANSLLGYEHIGKTVMVDDESLGTLWIEGVSDGICPITEISPFSNNKIIVPNSNTATDTSTNKFFKDTIKNINTNIVDGISSITQNLKKNTNSDTGINININTDSNTTYNISISSNSVIDTISKAASSAATDITNKLDSQIDSIISFSDETQKNLFSTALNVTGLGEDGFAQLVSMYNIASDISKGFESSFIDREIGILNAIIDGRALEHHLEPSYFQALEKAIKSNLENE